MTLADVTVTPEELSAITGYEATTLAKFVSMGMPGRTEGEYRLTDCVRWIIQHWRAKAMRDDDPLDDQIKREKLETARIEKEQRQFDLDKARGLYAGKAEVHKALAAAHIAFRDAHLGMGDAIASDMPAGLADEVRDAVNDRVRDALADMASATFGTAH